MNSPAAANGGKGGLVKVIEMRTARKREKIWRKEREPYKLLAEHTLDVILVLSADARVEYASPSIRKALGFKQEDAIGRNLLEWIHPDDAAHVRISMAHQIQIPGPGPALEFRFRHKDGDWRTLEAMPNNMIFDKGIHGYIMTCRDVSQRKQMEQELRKVYNEMAVLTQELEQLNSDLRESNQRLANLSNRDSLTSLVNRNGALEAAREHFAGWLRDGTQFSVQIIDIDEFKTISDTHGKLCGDNGLMLLSRVIASSIRATDMASRSGEDEFLVILSGTGAEEAAEIANKILRQLSDSSLESRRESVRMTASVGIATVGMADRNLDSLFARAENALRAAKSEGKNRVAIA